VLSGSTGVDARAYIGNLIAPQWAECFGPRRDQPTEGQRRLLLDWAFL